MTYPKALIIDDNSSDRALALREIKKLFPQLKYWEIIDETSFFEALQEHQFNLVITDYRLGWTTGLDILRCIQEQKADCPVIMFTGTGNEEIAVEAMKAGLDDYVIKSPQHYVRLAAAVRSAWQKFQARQALNTIQQTYDRFFERVPLGLYRLNSVGEIIEANSTLCKIMGYQQQQDLLGQNLLSYHLEPKAYYQWQKQLEQAETIEEWEGQIRLKNGQLIWVRHNAIAVKDAAGKLICYEGAIADISASKQAELERIELLARERQARKEAEKLNRIKDEFLATLSHELRTPLNAILGWIQLLRTGNISEAQINKALEVIERNAKAQNQLIEDLLDVSRIIRGTMKLQLQSVNLIEVIMISLDTVRPTAEAKNIKIKTQLESATIEIKADVERLQQVFWNLLINSIKFTPANGLVTISTEIKGSRVLVKLTDTGQGIADDVLPYIFDRFRQAETKSSTRTKGGLGLGLAIVRHLVEIHGGQVNAYSAGIGKGATFITELPLLSTANLASNRSNQSESKEITSLAGLTILVVEDDPDAREVLALILEQYHATIITADSVAQAIKEYQQQSFDLVISDISMPSEDGYTLIRQIRSSQDELATIPAIALTANAKEEDKRQALKAGFNLHLPKPIQPLLLIKSILQLMANK